MSEKRPTVTMSWGSDKSISFPMPTFEDIMKERNDKKRIVPALLKRGLLYMENGNYYRTSNDTLYLLSDEAFNKPLDPNRSGIVFCIPASRAEGLEPRKVTVTGTNHAGVNTCVKGLIMAAENLAKKEAQK